MGRVLAISSYVAYGHVGLSASVPILQAMGHEVIAVPTVVLSNHYGYATVGGGELANDQFGDILSALSSNDWLAPLDAVMTGFVASEEQVEGLARGLNRQFEAFPDQLYLCDPVIGDDPKGLYRNEDFAAALRDQLIPLADVVTPNRFELSWLSDMTVNTCEEADEAAEAMGVDCVVATSVPVGSEELATVVSEEDLAAHAITVRQNGVPNGTGDLFAALFLGHLLNGCEHSEALGRAVAGTDLVIRASLGAEELILVPNLAKAVMADPLDVEVLE